MQDRRVSSRATSRQTASWPFYFGKTKLAIPARVLRSKFADRGDLAESRRPIDERTLAEELIRHNELEFVGGMAYLSSLTDGLTRRENMYYYLRALQEYGHSSKRRKSRRSNAATGR